MLWFWCLIPCASIWMNEPKLLIILFEAAISKSFTVSYEDLKLPEEVQLRRFRTQQEASLSNAHVETGHKSKAKNIRTPLRNKIFPMNFEENLYLAVNKNYWDVELLLLVVNSDWSFRKCLVQFIICLLFFLTPNIWHYGHYLWLPSTIWRYLWGVFLRHHL